MLNQKGFSSHQPPLWSHLVVWRHCHQSLSVSRCLHSCGHLDSSCACVQVSSHGRLLYHCWAVWQGWSATCAEYFRAVWVQESSANDPAAAWHCPKVLLHYWRLRACLQRKRERERESGVYMSCWAFFWAFLFYRTAENSTHDFIAVQSFKSLINN